MRRGCPFLLAAALLVVPAFTHASAPDSTATGFETAPDSVTESAPRRHRLWTKPFHMVSDFGRDTWYVVTSPTRIHRGNIAEIALFLGTAGVLYGYDQAIYDAFRRNRDGPVLHTVIEVGEVIEPFGFMPNAFKIEGATWLLGAALQKPRMRQIALQLAEAHLIGGGVRNTMKALVGRHRPYEGRGSHDFELMGGSSFPSGHTSVYFETAAILSHHAQSRPVTVLLYTLAVAGAVDRVHSRSHWPSDVFLPAVSGTAIAWTVLRRHEKRAERLQPMLRADEGGVRVGVERRY